MQLSHGRQSRQVSISLTPLIDVVFILLLFFMLTSSFVPWRMIDANLTTKASPKTEEKTIYTLILKANDASFWYEDTSFSLKDFPLKNFPLKNFPLKNFPLKNSQKIEELLKDNKATFALKANAGVTLQSLIRVADYLKQQGVESISIANAFKSKATSVSAEKNEQ